VGVILDNMKDVSYAVFIARLLGGDEGHPLRNLLRKLIDPPHGGKKCEPWMASIAQWWLKDYDKSLEVLQAPRGSGTFEGLSSLPAFCKYLAAHPSVQAPLDGASIKILDWHSFYALDKSGCIHQAMEKMLEFRDEQQGIDTHKVEREKLAALLLLEVLSSLDLEGPWEKDLTVVTEELGALAAHFHLQQSHLLRRLAAYPMSSLRIRLVLALNLGNPDVVGQLLGETTQQLLHMALQMALQPQKVVAKTNLRWVQQTLRCAAQMEQAQIQGCTTTLHRQLYGAVVSILYVVAWKIQDYEIVHKLLSSAVLTAPDTWAAGQPGTEIQVLLDTLISSLRSRHDADRDPLLAVLDYSCHSACARIVSAMKPAAEIRALFALWEERSYLLATRAASTRLIPWCNRAAANASPSFSAAYAEVLHGSRILKRPGVVDLWGHLSGLTGSQQLILDCVARTPVGYDCDYAETPTEIFRNKGELLQSFCLRAGDEDVMVVSTASGLREVRVSSSVLYRQRGERDRGDDADPHALLDDEAASWSEGLHQFDGRSPSATHFQGGLTQRRACLKHRAAVPAARSPSRQGSERSQAVASLDAHPVAPIYVSASQQRCTILHFEEEAVQQSLQAADGEASFIRAHFNAAGTRVVGLASDHSTHFWCTDGRGSQAYHTLMPRDDEKLHDVFFLNAGTVVCCYGSKSISIWDTLTRAPAGPVLSIAHEGIDCCRFIAKDNTLVIGGKNGELSVFDIRREGIVKAFTAHDLNIKAICVDERRDVMATGSVDGDVKLWDLRSWDLKQSWTDTHHKQMFMTHGAKPFGVTDIRIGSSGSLYSCGADGTVKAYWRT